MLVNFCVVNCYCQSEKKRKEKTNTREKKNVKNVIKSDQLIHFCLTISSAFCRDESVSALRKFVQVIFTNYLLSGSRHAQVVKNLLP